MKQVKTIHVCPSDSYPCSRYDEVIGGICEIKYVGMPADVCPRYTVKGDYGRVRVDY